MLAYFVRHGESETNVSGDFPDDDLKSPHLTLKGKEQAAEAGEMLSKVDINAIISSPMPRTLETAEIISKKTGISVLVDSRLREVELGTLKGRPTAEVFKSDPEWFNEYFDENHRHGIEKYGKIQDRMILSVRDAYKKGFKSVVFVSHLEPIRSIIAFAMGIEGQTVRKIKIHNASISVLKYETGFELYAVNIRPLKDYSLSTWH
ncbi:MAG: histidine phosphatase family protein [Nitrososphaeria archaeon]